MAAKALYFEDIQEGMDIPSLVKGPMSPAHLVRWCAATENWHRIHYDQDFAVNHEKLPTVLVSGSWKQHVMCQLVKDWVGQSGWVWKISFQHRAMLKRGAVLTAWGKVTRKYIKGGLGFVECEIGMKNEEGVESCPGAATCVVPLKGGRPVPYPFSPPA